MAYNLQDLARTDIEDPIEPSIVNDVLSQPPFLPLPTALNIRDLGLLDSSPVSPGLVFSSGFISHLSATDQEALTIKHGIKRIYDLRTKKERERMPEPQVKDAEMIWVETELNLKTEIADFAEDNGVTGYVSGYMGMLRTHKEAFGRVIKDIASNDDSGILYHCTAGKDRTGIMSALLLSLAGASDELIVHNYVLSRIGVEPAREVLMKALKMSCPPDVMYETPGFKAICSIKEEYMAAFLMALRTEFGGVDGYCKEFVGMDEEQIERVRSRLRGL